MSNNDSILQIGKNVLKIASINLQNTQDLLDESFVYKVIQ